MAAELDKDIKELLTFAMVAIDRLWLNNCEGEEIPFIEQGRKAIYNVTGDKAWNEPL